MNEYNKDEITNEYNEDEIKDIIIRGYKNVLKRPPDPIGFNNYMNEFKKGLSIGQFYNALTRSEEYKKIEPDVVKKWRASASKQN